MDCYNSKEKNQNSSFLTKNQEKNTLEKGKQKAQIMKECPTNDAFNFENFQRN